MSAVDLQPAAPTCTRIMRGMGYNWLSEAPAPAAPANGEGRATAGAEGALGNNADFAPPPLPLLLPPTTVKAWHLRSYGREILKKHGVAKRIRWCGSKISNRQDGVGLYSRPDRAYGRVQGVCVCGQSLCCPVCAPRIAAFRAAEVAECFKRATSAGYEARLVTFTTPHTLNSTLGLEIDQFAVAWRRFQKGKQSDRLRKNSFGNHVGRECTWGARNGWHYHQHQLRYDLPGTFDEHRARAQWLNALDSVGRLWRGAELHAFDAGLIGDEAGARYIAKVATSVEAQGRAIGSEIASAATKGNNLATLLKRGLEGDSEASETWFSGVSDIITRKVSSVRWSRGLREKVGMSAEKSDEEIAQEEALPSDVFLGALTAAQWSGILRARCEFTLCVAANSGEDAVNELLANLNLGRLNDDAAPAVHVSLAADNVYRGITPVIK